MGVNDLTLAKRLSAVVNEACEGLEDGTALILSQVSETTAELLRWWFHQDYVDARGVNFHRGQRQAILNTIYAHEVEGVRSLEQLYRAIAPDVLLEGKALHQISSDKNAYPKYCLKMATGTGKTWVMQALIVWQLLNATRTPEDAKFGTNFLVVAPGLIVYDRLLDAFLGKERKGKRDFAFSDLSQFQALFIPEPYREEVFRFVQGATCTKDEIGHKVTAGGMIAITNWHMLSDDDNAEDEDRLGDLDLASIAQAVLPLTPGVTQGNELNSLNRRFERGNTLAFLRDLPELVVFNDEAHHIHEIKRDGEVTEVEWQKSLSAIAKPKGGRFVQVDFSATPYNQVTGRNAHKAYFPHIVVDFDLISAMREGLVKSLVLDRRSMIGALSDRELDFKAERDENNNPTLSEGQRIMLRAGLTKLKKLELEFTQLDPTKHPKMLVMCEDTSVTPLVDSFLRDEGLAEADILRIDSTRKGELKPDDWKELRETLFDMDRLQAPRVVISVLMLREGFDVNNICVIVPLRSSKAPILLEQTIGRGLRLMWRGDEFDDNKRENRQRIQEGLPPTSMIDILSIVEHPVFVEFYEELMTAGLLVEAGDTDEQGKSTGDLISVPLRDDFAAFDFAVPFVLRERQESIELGTVTIGEMPTFTAFTLSQLKGIVGKGERFVSEDLQSHTRFGDYRVDGGLMSATSYNDFVGRLVRRINTLLGVPITSSSKSFANHARFPYLQVGQPQLTTWLDQYIRQRLFGTAFDPFADENWRVLLVDAVADHLIRVWAQRLLSTLETKDQGDAEVVQRHLSEVESLTMREAASIAVNKCIYPRLPFPSRSGRLERSFMEMASHDATIEAFCKIQEAKHAFFRLRYLKDESLPGFYHPDFILRTEDRIYVVETKAQDQLSHPNVLRKRRAAVSWCEQVNSLPGGDRMGRQWAYVLLGEETFYTWRDRGASMEQMLDFHRLRSDEYLVQPKLDFG